MEPKRRRSKIPIKTIPEPVAWILENASGPQLDFLVRLGSSENLKNFTNLVSNFKHFNVYKLYNSKFSSPEELVAIRAAIVGEVSGLDALVMACQLAKEEKERRRRLKNA